MNTHPSDLIYQSNAARRKDLMAEATNERRASLIRRAQPNTGPVIDSMRQWVGLALLAAGNRLLGADIGEQAQSSTAK